MWLLFYSRPAWTMVSVMKGFLYLLLSELYLHGFAFHPYVQTEGATDDKRTRCVCVCVCVCVFRSELHDVLTSPLISPSPLTPFRPRPRTSFPRIFHPHTLSAPVRPCPPLSAPTTQLLWLFPRCTPKQGYRIHACPRRRPPPQVPSRDRVSRP